MDISLGLEWAVVCVGELVSLNDTSDWPIYLHLQEDILLLLTVWFDFDHQD